MNIDSVVQDCLGLAICAEIFRGHKQEYVGSFSSF